jgi:exonuclease SbcD
MSGIGLHFRTRLKEVDVPVVVENDEFTLLAYGIPYLEPDIDAGPAEHQWNVDSSQTGVLAEAMRLINLDVEARKKKSSKPVRVLVASHAFVQGASGSESERNIKDVTKVGGLGQADAAVFAGADYVAMGHIHRPHAKNEIKGPGSTILRYSGSPIPFSFSERDHEKQVLLVDITASGVKDSGVESIFAPKLRGMRQIEGTLEEVLSDKYPESDDWVKVILSDKEMPINVFETIKLKYKHLLDLGHQSSLDRINSTDRGEVLLQDLTPEEVTRRFVERVTHEAATDSVNTVIDNCCSEVRIQLSQVTKLRFTHSRFKALVHSRIYKQSTLTRSVKIGSSCWKALLAPVRVRLLMRSSMAYTARLLMRQRQRTVLQGIASAAITAKQAMKPKSLLSSRLVAIVIG